MFQIDGLPNFSRYGAPLGHLWCAGAPLLINFLLSSSPPSRKPSKIPKELADEENDPVRPSPTHQRPTRLPLSRVPSATHQRPTRLPPSRVPSPTHKRPTFASIKNT